MIHANNFKQCPERGIQAAIRKALNAALFAVTHLAAALPSYSYSLVKPIFPTEYKGVHSSIVAFSGLDSSNATMITVVQTQNVIDYCNYQRPPWEYASCYKETFKSHAGLKYYMYANCPAGQVTTHWPKTFKLHRKLWNPPYDPKSQGYWKLQWIDLATGRILESSGASGDDDITRIHYLLCPGFHPTPSTVSEGYFKLK